MARIPEDVIEGIKARTDLVALVKSRGVVLKKAGAVYKGRCPFHSEQTPSFTVNPAKRLWHCFGCNEGGDAIRFVEKRDGVSFREAVEHLNGQQLEMPIPEEPAPAAPASGAPVFSLTAVQRQKLLARVARFYHQRFLDRPEGLQYLVKQRGLKQVTLFRDYQLGLADGSLLEALPQDADSRAQFQALGVLTEQGRELLSGCVVFPLFDPQGNVVNLYGRRIEDGAVNHLYLPGPRVGLWNHQAAKRSRSLLLTESVIDALTLVDRGIADVLPAYGVHGLTNDLLTLFAETGTQDITLCFDGDDAGRRGAAAIAGRLREKRIAVHTLTLPEGEDINSFLSRHPVEAFQALLTAAQPKATAPAPQAAPAAAANTPRLEPTPHGFKWWLGPRCYDVKAIARQGTQLKATIKASVEGKAGFELHTLDLYSARSREAYAKSCAGLFEQDEARIKADLDALLERVEAWKPGEAAAPVIEMSAAEQREAEAFLASPDLLSLIQQDLTTLGVAGEDLNKLLCYLAAVSRKLDDPLSLLIQSRSAAGKSTLQNAVLSLVPDEDKVVYTRMTDQALFYQDELALKHKVLGLEEAEGLGGAAYSLRALQSSKKLSIATTSKDPATGKMKTEHYSVQGPVAVLLTTTSPHLDEETQSRFLTLTIDESAPMTQTIFEAQRHADTLDGHIHRLERDALIRKHHSAQRLLQPLAVINPYAPQLKFPAHGLRARRDHKKYLMLIKAVAFLRQKQHAVKTTEHRGEALAYIEVSRDDIAEANRLARHVLAHTVDELSAPARKLLGLVHEMVKATCEQQSAKPSDAIFTRRAIREHCGWSDWQVRTHIRELETLEYLHSRAGAWGKEYVYELTGELAQADGFALTDPDTLKDQAA